MVSLLLPLAVLYIVPLSPLSIRKLQHLLFHNHPGNHRSSPADSWHHPPYLVFEQWARRSCSAKVYAVCRPSPCWSGVQDGRKTLGDSPDPAAIISMRLVLFLSLLLRAATAHSCTLSAQGRADCSQSGLSKVPLPLPRNLRYLDLSANSIRHWKPFTATFPGLLHLNLSGNPLRLLPAGTFRDLSHLRTLDLSHCGISRIHPHAFKGLLRLQTLILRENPLEAISLRNIGALTRLDVRGTAMMASPGRGVLMDQLAEKRFCDCSSRRRLHGSSDRAYGDFCSCAALAERRGLHVQTASKVSGEVVKRYVRDANAVSNDSLSSNRTDPSPASPGSQGRSWPYLVSFVLIAGTVSLLIAIAAKCQLFHRYFRSYRHRPLTQNEWATESQNELPGVPLPPPDDEDGFIEDNYIQPEDHREDEDDTRVHHQEL